MPKTFVDKNHVMAVRTELEETAKRVLGSNFSETNEIHRDNFASYLGAEPPITIKVNSAYLKKFMKTCMESNETVTIMVAQSRPIIL